MNELELFKKYHPAYKYALDVINKKIPTNKFVTITCQQFLDEIDNKNSDYFFDFKLAKKISRLTKLFNMGGGLSSGKPVHDCLAGFQWFFIVNIFCWKYKDEPEKRRYETSVLLIARKSGKISRPLI